MKIAPSQHGCFSLRFALVAGFAGIFFSMSPYCTAQMAAPVAPKVPIPERDAPVAKKGFKTWSIFLVTNQQWLLRESSD